MGPRTKKRKTLPEPANACSPAEPEIEDEHTAFTTWSVARGVEINNVKPAKRPGRGLGLVTTAKIKEGKRILFVPEKAMFKPAPGIVKDASPQAQLAVSVMAACEGQLSGEMAIWKATWPKDLDFEHSMPIWWSNELQDLMPVSALQPLKRQLEDYGKDKEAVTEYLEANGHSSISFLYYWSIVNSRSFHWKPPKGKAGSMVACPFIDYINHAPSGITCDVFQRADGYEVVANREYEPGEELFATYGAHSNDKLLVHYGFVCASDPENPNNDDEVRLDHVLLPELSEPVCSQLQDVGFLGGYALLPATNELCFKTQVAVRAMLLTCNEWEYFVANGEDLAEDHTAAVREFVIPWLKKYQMEATAKLNSLNDQLGMARSMSDELKLLATRWAQIKDALTAFMEE